MPCVNAEKAKADQPTLTAFRVSAVVVILNSLVAGYLVIVAQLYWPSLLHLIAGPPLAYFLFRRTELSQLIAMAWAGLGLVMFPLALVFANATKSPGSAGHDFESIVYIVAFQVCFSGTLLVFLSGRTNAWRLVTGMTFATVFSIFTLLMIFGILFLEVK